MRNIDNFLGKVEATVKNHYLGGGAYARYAWQDKSGSRKMGINEYGCADAMNILYTLGKFPTGEDREMCLAALQSLQHEDTGLFEEHTHHFIHTTAHCIAALDLFDAQPIYPQKAMMKYFTKDGILKLYNDIRWETAPWRDSHEVAGAYVVGVLTDNVDAEWQDYYFSLLYDNTDDELGMSRKGMIDESKIPLFHHLYGWFHYMFNMQYAHRPLKYPDKLIDTCIRMYDDGLLGDNFTADIGFAQVDWVYALNRATRETPYRFHEAKSRLKDFCDKYLDYLESLNFETHEGLNDLHCLFGMICCVTELQAALPGELYSSKPLRLVLDRRPFI